MDRYARQRDIGEVESLGNGQFHEAEAMEGEAGLEALPSRAGGNEDIGRHGMAQVGGIEFTVAIQDFRVAQREAIALAAVTSSLT